MNEYIRKFRRAFNVSVIGQQILNLALFVLNGNFIRRLWQHSRLCKLEECFGVLCWNPSDQPEMNSIPASSKFTRECYLSQSIFILCLTISIIGKQREYNLIQP